MLWLLNARLRGATRHHLSAGGSSPCSARTISSRTSLRSAQELSESEQRHGLHDMRSYRSVAGRWLPPSRRSPKMRLALLSATPSAALRMRVHAHSRLISTRSRRALPAFQLCGSRIRQHFVKTRVQVDALTLTVMDITAYSTSRSGTQTSADSLSANDRTDGREPVAFAGAASHCEQCDRHWHVCDRMRTEPGQIR